MLDKKLEEVIQIHKNTLNSFNKIGIKHVKDLLYYFPTKYGNTFISTYIKNIEEDNAVTIYGKISNLEIDKTYKTNKDIVRGVVEDNTGHINIIWFNQIYISKIFKVNDIVKITGVARLISNKLIIQNPTIEKTKDIPLSSGKNLFGNNEEITFLPTYKETKKLSSKIISNTLSKIFTHENYKDIEDNLTEDILKKYNLPSLKNAFIYIHKPAKQSDADVAKKRFAFEEVFYIQLQNAKIKKDSQDNESYKLSNLELSTNEFVKTLGFKLTEAQDNAINSIIKDFEKGHPMSRLLEGDVGSGKTVVAAAASYAIISSRIKNMRSLDLKNSRLQVAYMAPTEILAKQHFESFVNFYKHLPVNIGLLTGSGCKKFPSKSSLSISKNTTDISKNQLLKWIENGEISIIIGTHALIQKSVNFRNLALVIIDEQHRFGTKQRQKLAEKHLDKKQIINKKVKKNIAYIDNKNQIEDDKIIQTPHLLSMTATPIPRTLALTLYGDLDLTVIDQMPSGRKPIITEIIPDKNRENMYKHILEQLDSGRQAYFICARITDPDPDIMNRLNLRSVTEEAKRLKENHFKKYNIGILHSKMKTSEKDKIMSDFLEHKIDILVATSVVEVGVNIPNSTNIVIEGADRFGLSQLHQLRGRVIRGNHQAYCFLCTDSNSIKTIERLNAIKNAKDGFELAEIDLRLRGAGELYGDKQWGLSDLGMEAIKNLKMVEAARNEAHICVFENKLTTYMLKKIEECEKLHME